MGFVAFIAIAAWIASRGSSKASTGDVVDHATNAGQVFGKSSQGPCLPPGSRCIMPPCNICRNATPSVNRIPPEPERGSFASFADYIAAYREWAGHYYAS